MSVDTHSRTLLIALFAALLGASSCAFGQDAEHIFEPGKKHVCVPAASGEGWDCGTDEQPPAAAPPREGPTLRSSRASDGTSTSLADVAAIEPVAAAPAQSASASDSPPPSRSVPSYLLAPPGGSSREAATPASSSAPVTNSSSADPPVVSEPATAAPVATAPAEVAPALATPELPAAAAETDTISTSPQTAGDAAAPPAAAQAAPAEASPPVADRAAPAETAPPSVVAAPAPELPAPTGGAVNSRFVDLAQQRADFAGLPGSAYVLDIAHGADRNAVAAAASIDLPVGQVWLLHLPRDGADWYVAVWGEFASVELAREARAEAASHGVAEVGWPRKVGPLQQESRLQH